MALRQNSSDKKNNKNLFENTLKILSKKFLFNNLKNLELKKVIQFTLD